MRSFTLCKAASFCKAKDISRDGIATGQPDNGECLHRKHATNCTSVHIVMFSALAMSTDLRAASFCTNTQMWQRCISPAGMTVKQFWPMHEQAVKATEQHAVALHDIMQTRVSYNLPARWGFVVVLLNCWCAAQKNRPHGLWTKSSETARSAALPHALTVHSLLWHLLLSAVYPLSAQPASFHDCCGSDYQQMVGCWCEHIDSKEQYVPWGSDRWPKACCDCMRWWQVCAQQQCRSSYLCIHLASLYL